MHGKGSWNSEKLLQTVHEPSPIPSFREDEQAFRRTRMKGTCKTLFYTLHDAKITKIT